MVPKSASTADSGLGSRGSSGAGLGRARAAGKGGSCAGGEGARAGGSTTGEELAEAALVPDGRGRKESVALPCRGNLRSGIKNTGR